MDAISLLKTDHRTVEDLFKEVQELGPTAYASRQRLFERIDEELTIHAKIEETIFYPALKERAAKGDPAKREVLEAYEEHANVKEMLDKLEQTDAKDETYAAKLQVLSELVKHHVREEEGEMFKQARELFEEAELKELGERMGAAKEQLKAAFA